MTSYQISLIKNSWLLVAKIDTETVGSLFYNRLFEVAPEVKPMFSKTPLPEQSRKLLGMLSYIINKLDKLDDILDEVKKLAQRHIHYGVKDEHYMIAGGALLWTLEKGLASNWTPDLRIAWMDCYRLLSGAMIDASKVAMATA